MLILLLLLCFKCGAFIFQISAYSATFCLEKTTVAYLPCVELACNSYNGQKNQTVKKAASVGYLGYPTHLSSLSRSNLTFPQISTSLFSSFWLPTPKYSSMDFQVDHQRLSLLATYDDMVRSQQAIFESIDGKLENNNSVVCVISHWLSIVSI